MGTRTEASAPSTGTMVAEEAEYATPYSAYTAVDDTEDAPVYQKLTRRSTVNTASSKESGTCAYEKNCRLTVRREGVTTLRGRVFPVRVVRSVLWDTVWNTGKPVYAYGGGADARVGADANTRRSSAISSTMAVTWWTWAAMTGTLRQYPTHFWAAHNPITECPPPHQVPSCPSWRPWPPPVR